MGRTGNNIQILVRHLKCHCLRHSQLFQKIADSRNVSRETAHVSKSGVPEGEKKNPHQIIYLVLWFSWLCFPVGWPCCFGTCSGPLCAEACEGVNPLTPCLGCKKEEEKLSRVPQSLCRYALCHIQTPHWASPYRECALLSVNPCGQSLQHRDPEQMFQDQTASLCWTPVLTLPPSALATLASEYMEVLGPFLCKRRARLERFKQHNHDFNKREGNTQAR